MPRREKRKPCGAVQPYLIDVGWGVCKVLWSGDPCLTPAAIVGDDCWVSEVVGICTGLVRARKLRGCVREASLA